MSVRKKTNVIVSTIFSVLWDVFCRAKPRPVKEDLRRWDWRTSTQRMGVRFTETIRRVFRIKWIKKA
jgi:hypothetical protein